MAPRMTSHAPAAPADLSIKTWLIAILTIALFSAIFKLYTLDLHPKGGNQHLRLSPDDISIIVAAVASTRDGASGNGGGNGGGNSGGNGDMNLREFALQSETDEDAEKPVSSSPATAARRRSRKGKHAPVNRVDEDDEVAAIPEAVAVPVVASAKEEDIEVIPEAEHHRPAVVPAAAAAPAVSAFTGKIEKNKMVESDEFPLIILTREEALWIVIDVTNVRALPQRMPAGTRPLDTLPYPPGIPSMAAYQFALASRTFQEMERFSNAHLIVNKAVVDKYQWKRDPLHSWSRTYEYVWHAEVVRALLPKAQEAAIADTWPSLPAPTDIKFEVLDAGSGFTFIDQFIGSRLGVHMVALDMEISYIDFFKSLKTALLPGERDVPAIPYILASIAKTTLLDASYDAIMCVSVLEHVHTEELTSTVKEFKRVLKRGGRLLLTFDTGQPPIAKNAADSKLLLAALRAEMVEDTTHGAPSELIAQDGKLAQALFTNRKVVPIEFGESLFTISGHVFINP
jgi:SAM-dependent methyltransferase